MYQISRGGAAAARVAHNHKVAGSSPAPATKYFSLCNRAEVFLSNWEYLAYRAQLGWIEHSEYYRIHYRVVER